MHDKSPIIAMATASGRGGIGVIRISGPNLGPLIFDIIGQKLKPRYAHFCNFPDSSGIAIDQGIAIYFIAPSSYTGEDVLELQGHGGPAVLQRLINRCIEVGSAYGLRLALPGEFTLRAFLNNKIDLAQAEAVADLVDASSEAAARAAISSYSGEFSREINDLVDSIIELRVMIESTLDFPEEEIEFLEKFQTQIKIVRIQEKLSSVFEKSQQGMVLRQGLYVVLTGEPNVGKSSLLNALSGEDLAIVTDIAGTTRDKVSQLIYLNGVPITIVDTAGLRESQDKIEMIGIQKSWNEISKADVILHLKDFTSKNTILDEKIILRRSPNSVVLTVFNKIDLTNSQNINKENELYISVKTGQGLKELSDTLLKLAGWQPNIESPWFARQRHIDALKIAQHHLTQAYEYTNQSDQMLDLLAEELRIAHNQLGCITGRMTADELLGEIFSRFCIGK